jgi:hypothetical protein
LPDTLCQLGDQRQRVIKVAFDVGSDALELRDRPLDGGTGQSIVGLEGEYADRMWQQVDL